MLNLQKYRNKNVAIYGMGITGYSAAKVFKKLGAKVFCWDDNVKIRNKVKNLNFTISKFWLKKEIIKYIVISPGINTKKCKIKKYFKKNSSKIITDLDIFFELNKDSLMISITGTNGKSTTCKLIEKILKQAKYKVKTVGNIGNPILSHKNIKKNILVLEVSSYQLQYSKVFHSKHAAILNISPDHLERHGSIQNYIKVKSKIFYGQKKSDYSYLNFNSKYTKYIKNILKKNKIKSQLSLIDSSKYQLLVKKINNKYFKNKGNFENLIFAYKIAKKLNIKDSTIFKAVNRFEGLPHRQEIVFSNKKITCINDSKATSFHASYQSLVDNNEIYWIVGGLPKHKDYFNLKDVKTKIIKAYIIGKKTYFFEKKIKNNISYEVSKNLQASVDAIYKDIKLSDNKYSTILFSPAAASFDQFKNFEDRGEYFKKLILKKFKREANV